MKRERKILLSLSFLLSLSLSLSLPLLSPFLSLSKVVQSEEKLKMSRRENCLFRDFSVFRRAEGFLRHLSLSLSLYLQTFRLKRVAANAAAVPTFQFNRNRVKNSFFLSFHRTYLKNERREKILVGLFLSTFLPPRKKERKRKKEREEKKKKERRSSF